MFIPVILFVLGGVFFMILVKTGGASGILTAFGNLLWWGAGLLALFNVANIIGELLHFFGDRFEEQSSKPNEKKERRPTRINAFFSKVSEFVKRHKKASKKTESVQEIEEELSEADTDELNEIPAELKNIKRDTAVSVKRKREKNIFDNLYLFFGICFVGALAAWLYFFCTKMLAAAVPPETDTYSYGLLTTLYFLFFAVALSIYTKMRTTPEKKVTYRISGDLAKLFSVTAIVYAGIIAVQSVLAINALAVIPWVLRAVAVYITVALAVDLIIALLKGDLLGEVDYPILPSKEKGQDVLESDDVKARFSLKSLWSIQYAVRLLPGIALAVGGVLLVSTMFYVVQPGEQAALYRFGTIDRDAIMDPGLHVKLPWPIDKVDVYDVDSVTTVRIGYDNPTGTDYLWTMSHGGEEYPLLTGNGNEVVAVNIKLAYKIGDLYSFVNTATDPEAVISAAAYESIMRRTINTTLDAFLSVDRASLSLDLKSELAEFSREAQLGIEVVDVIIENIHPPVDVADVYQAVITASVDKQTLITQATATALEDLNYAMYYKEQLINDALKKQAEAVGAATGEMAYYYAAMEAYKVNPECFKLTQFINVQAKRIAGTKVYYFSPKTEEYVGSFIIGGTSNNVVVTEQ